MSTSQPLLDVQHLQHANPYFDHGSDFHSNASSSTAYHLSRFHLASSSSSSPGSAMDPSQFGDFAFPYGPLSGSIPDLSDQSPATFDDQPSADQFTLHSAVSSVPTPNFQQSNVNSARASQQPTSFAMDSDYTVMKSEMANDVGDNMSPNAESPADGAHDEFGVSAQYRADGTDLGARSKDDKSDAAPAWSELKTKAGKDRKRLPLACIACRRKKIRCSGEKPACKHCLRSRTPCVYKVTSRKAAPRTDYMAMLDKRLKRMEERIIKVVPKADQEASPSMTRAVVKPNIPGQSNSKAPKKRRADEAFTPSFEAWASGSSKPAVGTEQHDGSTALLPSGKEDSKLFEEGAEALPSKEIQEHLAEVFFDYVYGQPYHLLHKPSYMRKLKNNSLPPVLSLSVCAVAVRFSSNPKLNSTTRPFLRGEEWASRARDICTKRYEWPNITILTCLVLLGVHEFGTCHGGRSWALSGQAIRMAYALQLHKDLEYDPQVRGAKKKLSFVDREIRRRAMWACFLMDRSSSSGTDRPMFIQEDSIQIPLPVSERHFELDMPAQTEMLGGLPANAPSADLKENMGAAAYIIRAIAIWGRVITYLNHGGREMDPYPIWHHQSQFTTLVSSGENLLQNLPSSLEYSRENLEMHVTQKTASQLLLLHATISQITLFLYQSAAAILQARGSHDVPKEFIQKLTGRTFAAANRISQLLRDAEDTQCAMWAPFGGYCAFSSTSVQLLAMTSGNPALKATAEANCAVNIKFLRKLMRHWGMFHWMVEDIRKQYKSNHDAVRKGTAGISAAPPLLQYADWFNRYPHGVADTEFMDPSAGRKRERGDDAVLEQKTDLQSVEDFFTTLSPAGQSDNTAKPGPNRKAAPAKKQSSAAARPAHQQAPDAKAVAEARRRTSMQTNSKEFQQAAAQRRFSSPQGNHSASPATFNHQVSMGQANQQYLSMSPISPGNMSQFPSQPTNNNMGFFGEVMPMNLQQENAMSQSMFTLTPGGMGGSQQVMDGWQGNQTRVSSGPPVPPAHGHMSGQNMNNVFAGSSDASSWFMPYDVEPTEVSQEMAMSNTSNMDDFDGMFGSVSGPGNSQGMMVQNHMRGV